MNITCKLNQNGIECYKYNQKNKNIPPDHEMEIIDIASHDSGREIYLIQSKTDNNLKDYYFEDHINFGNN